jgi:methionyl-tRNA synthetase
MTKKETKAANKQVKPRVHKDLKGFEVSIDQFGELTSSMNIEKINSFLDKNVDDKKLLEKEEKERLKKLKKQK